MAGANRALLSVLAALTLADCSSTPAPTPTSPNHDAENAAWIARDFTCTRAEAKPVARDALTMHPEHFAESCVRVNGFLRAQYFTSNNRSDFLGLFLVRDANQKSEIRSERQIRVHLKDQNAYMRFKFSPTFVILTGRVRSCVERNDRQTAATTPLCGIEGFELFVSDVQVVPTAMD